MSQKKVQLYNPETGQPEWFMEDEAPAGWSNQPPVTEEQVAESESEVNDLKKQVEEAEGDGEPTADPEPDPVEGDVQPGEGDGTLKGSDPEEEAEAAEDGGDMQDPEAAA